GQGGVRHRDPAQRPPVGSAEPRHPRFDLRSSLPGLRSLYRAGPRADRPPAPSDKGRRMTDSPRKRPAGLGRGLSSLLGEVQQEAPVRLDAEGGTRGSGVQMIPIAGIEPNPAQPRRVFAEEALAELAASIQARGVIQ